MAHLIIVRGRSGAGKSTFAKDHLIPLGFHHYENDMYFMRNGQYMWDQKEMGKAIGWCAHKVETDLAAGFNVVVTNTFVRLNDMRGFIDYCNKNGHTFEVIEIISNFKNTHNVPDERVQSMIDRFQPYPGATVIHL